MPFLERCVEQHRYGQARIPGHYLSREDDVAGSLLHLRFTKQQDSATARLSFSQHTAQDCIVPHL